MGRKSIREASVWKPTFALAAVSSGSAYPGLLILQRYARAPSFFSSNYALSQMLVSLACSFRRLPAEPPSTPPDHRRHQWRL